MNENLERLKNHLREVNHLRAASAVLNWDQTTYMPPGGAPSRAAQLSTLRRLAHEKFVAPEIGRLLDALQPYEESLPYEHDDAALVRVTRRDYDRQVKVSADFTANLSNHAAATYNLWTQARPADDFARVSENLERTLDFSRAYSQFFPGHDHIADPHIELSDYGMTASMIRDVFAELRKALVPLVAAIRDAGDVDAGVLHREYPEAAQLAFSNEVIRDIGYDFDRGRLDKTHHPFCTRFAAGDVRITTRVDERDFGQALFSCIHEAGHAMYEQGVHLDYDGTPLARGTSSGTHESQSRLWENVVGRSSDFWEHYLPRAQVIFPTQLGDVDVDTFVKAINRVTPSLIRTDADEVTYNLHVMIRFDLELDLLEGRLSITDLPEAWRERYRSDLGVAPSDDRDGVLQDVHWFAGMIGGAFQGYTLGNIMSAQFFEAAERAHPSIREEIAAGQFATLRGWLTDNLYQHGRKFTASELLERVTGQGLTIEPYMRYLRTKYGGLYAMPLRNGSPTSSSAQAVAEMSPKA